MLWRSAKKNHLRQTVREGRLPDLQERVELISWAMEVNCQCNVCRVKSIGRSIHFYLVLLYYCIAVILYYCVTVVLCYRIVELLYYI